MQRSSERGAHHDILVTALEFHCNGERVAHETPVQFVQPILVPKRQVRANCQAVQHALQITSSFQSNASRNRRLSKRPQPS
jgi:hypothetical protein